MTTSYSPIKQVRAQAAEIVFRLRTQPVTPAEFITFAVVMDDKVLKITWTWQFIRSTAINTLIDMLVKKMTSR